MKATKLTRFLPVVAWTALITAWFGTAVCEAQTSGPAEQEEVVPIGKLERMLKEADAAMDAKDYPGAVTKTEDLIKVLTPQTGTDERMEQLYFNVGLANLLGERFPEAEASFTRCAAKYPKGRLASRCALGLGKACIGQDTRPKNEQAIEALTRAMQDPKLNAEAGLALARLYSEMGHRKETLEVIHALIGPDIRTPGQTAVAVGVISLLADEGKLDDLADCLERMRTMAGVRNSIAWYVNQVIVRGDDAMSAQDYDTALAIFQTVPLRNQIVDTQTQALDRQRETLATLGKIVAKEDEAERANPDVPRARTIARELVATLKPAMEANEKALSAIQEFKDLDAALVMRRGRCFYHLKRYEEALLCFRTLRLKYPTYKDTKLAAFTEIMVMQQLKKSAGILELCQGYVAAYPDSEDAEPVATLAGEQLVEQARWKEVATYYADLETRFPKSTNLDRFLFYQGYSHFLDADFNLSTPLFEKILKNYPKSLFYEPALYHVAMTFFLKNEDKKAIASCGEYLAKYPNGMYAGDIQYRISFIESNDKSVPPAKIIADLEAFLKTHPGDLSNGSMRCLLGDTYKKKGDDDKAIEAYIKAALSKSPDDVMQYALDCAIEILQAKKDWDAIAKLIEDVRILKPGLLLPGSNTPGRAHAGRTPEEAIAALADSLNTRLGDPTIQQVESLLDLMVQALVPRKKPAREAIDTVAEQLDKQLAGILTKVSGDNPNSTASARLAYAQARLSQLLYRTSRTERSDLLLKGIATQYASEPAVLSPTLLSVCGDILLEEGNLDAAQAMYQRLTDRFNNPPFADAGPLGMGKLALARKQAEEALKIFERILANNNGNVAFKEATLGKVQALIDLGQYQAARTLAQNVVGNKMFHGEMAGKANLISANSYRVEAARMAPGDAAKDLLKKALAAYQVICISYQSLPEICAEAYWQAYQTAKQLHDDALAAENLKTLANHPKLQFTRRAKEAKELVP